MNPLVPTLNPPRRYTRETSLDSPCHEGCREKVRLIHESESDRPLSTLSFPIVSAHFSGFWASSP